MRSDRLVKDFSEDGRAHDLDLTEDLTCVRGQGRLSPLAD